MSESIPQPKYRNRILAALPLSELEALAVDMTSVRLVENQSLQEPLEPILHVYFIEQGFASVVAAMEMGRGGVEVGMIGKDSMTGLQAMFSPDTLSFNRVMIQMSGSAYRLPVAALRKHIPNAPVLHRHLLQALEIFVAQVSQTAACNSRHALSERMSRWLLTAHDLADNAEIPIIQEFLAMMLGVRRPGVTTAMGVLQETALIRYTRARITLLDRVGLENTSCSCYGRIELFGKLVRERH